MWVILMDLQKQPYNIRSGRSYDMFIISWLLCSLAIYYFIVMST